MANEVEWVVSKFGGTSVASLERWKTIEQVVREHLAEGRRPMVVCSALSGISNLLEKLLAQSEAGEDASGVLEEILAKPRALADDMDLDAEALLGERFEELGRITQGIRLVEEASPRIRARAMSMGELMSTTLGAAWLNARGVKTSWQDAREMLQVEPRGHDARLETRFLSNSCSTEFDPVLTARLSELDADVVLTQGFIARDEEGDTVLLGRGGSDTSAATFAARVRAERLEIWTDVPGMFTTNPRRVPSARLLRHLDYAEAEQLALMGAKVLHPRCIAPVAAHDIPLHIRCTPAPAMTHTVISRQAPSSQPIVKAVSAREGIAVLSVDVDRALENVGNLADTARHFARRGLSIDMVSASETNLTFSLDPAVNVLEEKELQGLVEDIQKTAPGARLLGPGAAVSLVGTNIRAMLHELGPILERFEDLRVYMVSQAADDLNFTFVVQEDQADRLIMDLHALLFDPTLSDPSFGPSWEQLFDTDWEKPRVMKSWWQERREKLIEEAEGGTPCYVYRLPAIDAALAELETLKLDRLFYSVKANDHAAVLKHLEGRGTGFQCCTRGELERVVEQLGKLEGRLLFAPHGAVRADFERAFELGAHVVVDSLTPLQTWPETFRGRSIFLRVDPGRGAGEHPFVSTAGPQSKHGIAPSQLEAAKAAVEAAGVEVVGLHAHAGSGLRTSRTWPDMAELMLGMREAFPNAKVLDLGGGLGVPERVGHRRIDFAKLAAGLAEVRAKAEGIELWMEPGRYLAGRAGVLLAHVTDVVEKDGHTFITVDAGMNTLIRPALYGAWHETVNLTRYDAPREILADVVGPLGDSSDVLANDRLHPKTERGDVILIGNAGAYGRTMASGYNATEPPREAIDE